MEEGKVELVKIHTKENPMDVLTKVLSWDSIRKYVTLMCLTDRMELIDTLGH